MVNPKAGNVTDSIIIRVCVQNLGSVTTYWIADFVFGNLSYLFVCGQERIMYEQAIRT